MSKLRSTIRAFSLAALVAGSSPAAADVASVVPDGGDRTDVTALMRRVALAYADATRGTIGVRSTSLLTIEAPLFHRRIADDGWFVFADGSLARSSTPPDPRRPQLHDPYDARYLAEYRFRFVGCAGCRAGDVAVAYESPSRDAAHATGTLVIESATAHVVHDTERPYKLPWPTRDGALEATWGAAADGWFPQTIAGDFVGRIGPFVGHARYAQTLSAYARFPNVDDAASSLGARPQAVAPDASPAAHAP